MFDLIVLWVAVLGQTAFVVLWFTQRWWTTGVGRALMAKSAALAILLIASMWAYYLGPIPGWLGHTLGAALAAAIVFQLVALILEIRRASQDQSTTSS